jgi:hypothetical protein
LKQIKEGGREKMGKLAIQEMENRLDIRKTVDSVIESVGDRIKSNDTLPGEYADTIKALAMLVEARASLH